MAENKLTEAEEKIRQQLVKIASDNDVYFVVWYGHINNYFVGVRNCSKKEPAVYAAIYEMFYDLMGDEDRIIFQEGIGIQKESNQRLPWEKMLGIARAEIVDKKDKEVAV